LLRGGYSVSGSAALLDEYLQDKDVLSMSVLGGLKTVCLNGEMPGAESVPQGIEVGKLNLQDYFISLMNASEG